VPDKLIDPTSMTNMHKITPMIGVMTTGQPADSVRQVERMRAEAAQFMYENGYAIPVHHLAKRMADVNQVFSQRAGTRTMAVISIICGIDAERGAQLFKVDPAGQIWGFHACAAGVKQMAAQNHFEKVYKDAPTLDRAQTVQEAILCLQTVLQVDLHADDIEVSIAHDDEVFRNLNEAEIETHLQALADRD
jgi:20S proteasome subunit alpha 1